jgi:hypothetical protein
MIMFVFVSNVKLFYSLSKTVMAFYKSNIV